MKRQLTIVGTTPEHPEIDEAAEEVRIAKEDAIRATDKLHQAQATLISRMMDKKLARHSYEQGDSDVTVSLDLPQPVVRVKVERHEDDR